MHQPAIISANNISLLKNNWWAFRDISLDIAAGHVYAIFGRVDSGISELLDVLAQEIPPTKGSIVKSEASAKLDLIKHDFNHRIFQYLLNIKATLSKVIESYQYNLRERLKGSPSAIFTENPFLGLSLGEREELISLFKDFCRKRNGSVVFTTSDFQDCFAAADVVFVFDKGYLWQSGSPKEIYEAPESPHIAALTGAVNLIKARRLTSSKSENPEFQTIDGNHRIFTGKHNLSKLGAINRDITLAIRPEQITLNSGSSFPEDNLLRAVLTAITFRGSYTEVQLDCNGLLLKAFVPRLVGLSTGDECVIGLPRERILILGN